MTPSAIDHATFDELRETVGGEFANELADTFLADAPTMLAALRKAFEARDAETFRRTAHSLKSNGATFGARTLAAMAKALEQGGMAPVEAAAGAPLADLDAEYARVAAELEALKRA
ncbi:MAG: Hpt domain-containing protein [Proteobacteria bacterium]|nr:Hpt domain-containing protein [Pseudomonadota bacterium]